MLSHLKRKHCQRHNGPRVLSLWLELSFQLNWICNQLSCRLNSSFRLNTLGPLCLWQCFLQMASSVKKRSSLSNISSPRNWHLKFKLRNYIHFDILCSLYKESYIERRSWSIIFPGAPSQLWMIEYSRTNIKFRSLPLMDVINLSDRIFSAFQTPCRNICRFFQFLYLREVTFF